MRKQRFEFFHFYFISNRRKQQLNIATQHQDDKILIQRKIEHSSNIHHFCPLIDESWITDYRCMFLFRNLKKKGEIFENDVTVLGRNEVDVAITEWLAGGRVPANANGSETLELRECFYQLGVGDVGVEVADVKRGRNGPGRRSNRHWSIEKKERGEILLARERQRREKECVCERERKWNEGENMTEREGGVCVSECRGDSACMAVQVL